jgi:glutamyl-tRNA reductase
VGTHHRNAPVEVRERLAFSPDYLHEVLLALRRYVSQGFIVSTCNRVEVYGLVPAPPDDLTEDLSPSPSVGGPSTEPALSLSKGSGRAGGSAVETPPATRRSPLAAPLIDFLAGSHQGPMQHVLPHLYVRTGADAVRHLFRLAAGLDSMVLGEDQIVGQLKQAFALARQAGLGGRLLNRLQHDALAAGKLIRSQTDISRSHLSIVSVALELARSSVGGLGTRQVLVVGAGHMAELALKHLRDGQCAPAVANRTYERAQTLAERYGGAAWRLEELDEAIRQAEVVVSCTAAPDIVITQDVMARAMAGRSAPLLVLDLAVPRDVDPGVSDLTGVTLRNVDDLQAICEANRAARAAEVERAEALLQAEVDRFMRWWAGQHAVPTIRALRARAEAIRQAELRRTLSRLPNLSEREQALIHALSASIVNKLLHDPVISLKDPDTGAHMARVVEHLFRLSDDGAEAIEELHASRA